MAACPLYSLKISPRGASNWSIHSGTRGLTTLSSLSTATPTPMQSPSAQK